MYENMSIWVQLGIHIQFFFSIQSAGWTKKTDRFLHQQNNLWCWDLSILLCYYITSSRIHWSILTVIGCKHWSNACFPARLFERSRWVDQLLLNRERSTCPLGCPQKTHSHTQRIWHCPAVICFSWSCSTIFLFEIIRNRLSLPGSGSRPLDDDVPGLPSTNHYVECNWSWWLLRCDVHVPGSFRRIEVGKWVRSVKKKLGRVMNCS